MKKILLVDDSALMRRVLSGIINTTNEYTVAYIAKNGAEGLEIIESHDDIVAVVCDVNMPVMTGIELLSTLRRKKIMIPLILLSTKDEAAYMIAALELGALAFLIKPTDIYKQDNDVFASKLISVLNSAKITRTDGQSSKTSGDDYDKNNQVNENILAKHEAIREKGNVNVHTVNKEQVVANTGLPAFDKLIKKQVVEKKTDEVKPKVAVKENPPEAKNDASSRVTNNTINNVKKSSGSKKLIALVSSTGGPKALRTMIPMLPANLDAPIVMVQHMPANFTTTLAERLNELSAIEVSEVAGGEYIKKGHVYLARGGMHLRVEKDSNGHFLVLDDSPPVVGLKPCGNLMYDSLVNCGYDDITCVVLTGMGADGTNGIINLAKHKNIYVIAQDEASSTVYGMPRAIYEKGMCDVVCDINDVAKEIVKKVGVR